MNNLAPLLAEKPSVLREQFINDYAKLHGINPHLALGYIKAQDHFEKLTEEWYERLSQGDLDGAYAVYNDDYYFTDLWTCFVTYSRSYLHRFYKPAIDGQSILDLTGHVKVIADIGCGIGYTTTALKQMYPGAEVYGVNLKGTKEWTFCEMMATKHNFHMVGDVRDIPVNVDLVFASEFFEHILNPIEYVDDIIRCYDPKFMIIANAFNTRSIGHFNRYELPGLNIDASIMSKWFNAHMRMKGYDKLRTTLYNGKPNVWVKR